MLPTQCAYCTDTFIPKVKNKFGWQKVCGKLDCKKKQKRELARKSIDKNREHYKRLWQKRNRRLHPPKAKPVKPPPFFRCFQCDYAIRSTDTICGRCGWVVDIKKVEMAQAKYK